MPEKQFCLLFLFIFIGSLSCTGGQKDSRAAGQPDQKMTTSPPLAPIYNADFELRCKPVESASNEPPREMHYLVRSDKLTKPVLITTEPSCNQILDHSAFDIPNQTAFARHGYYAGGGYYYYGRVENDTLKIYRKWVEKTDADANSNSVGTTYKLFKTILVYPDGSSKMAQQREKSLYY